MLIRIKQSQLFNTPPSKRFASQYNVPEALWHEIWRRYKLLDYSIADLADLFHLKANRPIKRRYMKRWIFLQDIYTIVKPARDMGAEVVNTELFGPLEHRVIEEVTRHMKTGDTRNCRIIL